MDPKPQSNNQPNRPAATATLVADLLENIANLTSTVIEDAHRVAATWTKFQATLILQTSARAARGLAEALKKEQI